MKYSFIKIVENALQRLQWECYATLNTTKKMYKMLLWGTRQFLLKKGLLLESTIWQLNVPLLPMNLYPHTPSLNMFQSILLQGSSKMPFCLIRISYPREMTYLRKKQHFPQAAILCQYLMSIRTQICAVKK